MRRTSLFVGILVLLGACGGSASSATADPETTTAPQFEIPCGDPDESGVRECSLSQYPRRPYLLYYPPGLDSEAPLALVVALHGGGGNSLAALRVSCPEGDLEDPACFHRLGDSYGFITAAPNGNARQIAPEKRTWNAGGGSGGWLCVSGYGCRSGFDDVAYLQAVLDDLAALLPIDPDMVYFIGLSNGGAMAHRVACQMSDRVTAIAAVGSGNQFATTADCDPELPVSVMDIHGTDDPCWTYETSDRVCLDGGGDKVGAVETVEGWRDRLNCGGPPQEEMIGSATLSQVWSDCDGDVEVRHLRIGNAGHTWPGGYSYSPESRVGALSHDFDSEFIWKWLAAQTR